MTRWIAASISVPLMLWATAAPVQGAAIIEIDVPVEIEAGDTATLAVSAAGAGQGTVIVSGTVATVELPLEFESGVARLVIGPPITEAAGVVVVAAAVEGLVTWSTFRIRPGDEIGDIQTSAAPERLDVASSDMVTVAAILSDRHGNPMPDGTPAEIGIRRPDGSVDGVSTDSRLGVVLGGLDPGHTGGSATVFVRSGGVEAATVVSLQSSTIVEVRWRVEGPVPPADGRSQVVLVSEDLYDRFGNPIPEGTAITVVVEHEDKRIDLISAAVTAQRLRIGLTAPAVPESLWISAVAGTEWSTPFSLRFEGTP